MTYVKDIDKKTHYIISHGFSAGCVVSLALFSMCCRDSKVRQTSQKDGDAESPSADLRSFSKDIREPSPCDALFASGGIPGASGASLPCAKYEAGEEENYCPTREQIVFVFDYDQRTRMEWIRRFENLETVWSVFTPQCDTLGAGIPHYCDTIQRVARSKPPTWGKCSDWRGGRWASWHREGEREITPAPRAVRRICQSLTDGEIELAVITFDGVSDSPNQNASPASLFGEAVAGCVKDGLSVSVGIAMTNYQYVYTISTPRTAQYGYRVADNLIKRFGEKEGFAVRLDGGHLARGARAKLAQAQLKRLPRGFNMPSSIKNNLVNLHGWAKAEGRSLASWQLSYENDEKQWAELAPFGMSLGPPVIHTNRTFEPRPYRDRAFATIENSVAVQSDLTCRPWPTASQCGEDSSQFYQSAFVWEDDLARVDIDLLSESDSLTSDSWQKLLGAAAFPKVSEKTSKGVSGRSGTPTIGSDTADTKDDTEENSALLATTMDRYFISLEEAGHGGELLVFSLESPALKIHPCAEKIQKSVHDSYAWTPGNFRLERGREELEGLLTDPMCQGPQWHKLVAAFYDAASKEKAPQFASEGRSVGSARTKWAALESLAAVIAKVSAVAGKSDAMASCSLFRFGLTCQDQAVQ